MNLNKNDYVVVNGKKYYADGGEIRNITERKIPLSEHWGHISTGDPHTPSEPKDPSEKAGHQYFRHLPNNLKESYLAGRGRISDYLIERFKGNIDTTKPVKPSETASSKEWDQYDKEVKEYKTKIKPIKEKIKAETGIDLDEWNKDTKRYGKHTLATETTPEKWGTEEVTDNYNGGFNNENSRKVYKYLSNLGGNMFTPDSDGEVRLGSNVIESVGKFYHSGTLARKPKEEVAAIKNILSSYPEYSNVFDNNNFTRAIDDEGNKYYNIVSKISNGNPNETITIALDKDNHVINLKKNNVGNIEFANDDTDSVPFVKNWQNKQGTLLRFKNNDTMYSSRDDDEIWKEYNTKNKNGINPYYSLSADDMNWYDSEKGYACGGRTSRRTYAEGGSMGTPIPLGEQEDYNMVGAGGSHEENPQGGVPYGINQDGTQNMVEEGEVTVGNNVFSDRIQLSPELCQQLGLPEGTTPAQAMQQIEQLYEQGQIGNDEFQEIQNIIFQDQESQKQGEEIQQEMPPNEGISPDMIQGANMPQGGGMPPEMMQQQGAPMTPQNEGIQPEMVQGYAYGGRMW